MSDYTSNQRNISADESENKITTEAENGDLATDANSAECCADNAPTPRKKVSWKKEAVDYMELFVFSIAFVMLLFSFLFRICTVEGESMENTLFAEEKLIVSDLFYTPESGDIIVFHQTGDGIFSLNEPIVKRVIATEGETVKVNYFYDTMRVTVTHADGSSTVLDEPYMKYEGRNRFSGSDTYTVPEGHIFVLGDNRNNSTDSRYTGVIGMVDARRILGKVLFRVTPVSRLGAVE